MMRLLFTRFPLESAFGGAEIQTLTLMRGLKERGLEVSFLGSCPVLLERTKELGMKNQELRIGPPPVTKWGAVSFLWRKRKMQRKLMEGVMAFLERDVQRRVERPLHSSLAPARDSVEESTVLLMLSLTEKLLLTDWAVECGIKVFWIEHDRIGRWLRWNPWLPRLRKLSALATTITVSDLSRDLYLALGFDPERTVSIPNGIDVERFAGSTRVPRVQHGRDGRATFHIGCIARLTRDKGVDVLLGAIASLQNVSLMLVGEGPGAQRILRRIAQPDLYGRVTLVAKMDPRALYGAIDALVLPSRDHDPFGLVVAEAMAAGVPTILTDACGIARHLTQEEAVIVPAGNPEALRQGIVAVMEEPSRRALAERGPRVAREKFGCERMIEAYASLLER